MAYRVSLSAPADDDAYAAFERIREAAPMHAEQWLVRLFAAIDRGEGPAAASDTLHGECPTAAPGCIPPIADATNADPPGYPSGCATSQ